MGAAIPSFIWGQQFLVFVIIMSDCNQNFTPTSLCCFYALLGLFTYEQRGFKQLQHSPKVLGGGGNRTIMRLLNSYKRWEEKVMWYLKKLSNQTNNCRFLVSINAKTICSYFLVFSGLTYSGLAVWEVVVEFDNKFIGLGPIATGASSVKKLAGPHRCLPVRQELVLEAIPATSTHPQTGCFSVPGQAHELIPVKNK